MTGAFSFGRITGRLSGAIDGLQLFNWTPVAFDARLYTPPDDRSKHRISQRAVENIGSIGGGGAGVTAALSSGFLRFFEDFNYDRLGLSCRLRERSLRHGRRRAGAERRLLPRQGQGRAAHRRHRQLAPRRLAAAGAAADRGHRIRRARSSSDDAATSNR